MEIINAILLGILDQKKGQYVNPRTGDTMLITDAISRGLIVADVKSTSVETDSAEDARILADRQTVYTLKSVIDPRSGRHISVSEVRSFINGLRVLLYPDENRSDITFRWVHRETLSSDKDQRKKFAFTFAVARCKRTFTVSTFDID